MPANNGYVNAARQACVICETRAPLKTPPETHVHGFSPWQRLAIWPLSVFIRLWWRTIEFSVPEEDRKVITLMGEPTLFILWHNRLFIAAEIARRYRNRHPIYGLVSASRDGAWLAALFTMVGLRSVRGSSSRLGREAVTGLVEALAEGNDACVTPDGPRGPCYEMKPGALVVAQRAHARIVLIGIDFESSWRLSSWDGFHLPKPFTRAHMRFQATRSDQTENGADAARTLGARLSELNPDRKAAPPRRRAKS